MKFGKQLSALLLLARGTGTFGRTYLAHARTLSATSLRIFIKK